MTGEIKKNEEKIAPNLRIGVIGALGSGKSTVSGLIHENMPGSFVIEERFGLNPHLAKFYKEPKRWSLHSQTWFLTQKLEQYSKMSGLGTEIVDPPLEMDWLYAHTQFQMGWMSSDEWTLYQGLYETLVTEKGISSPGIFIAIKAADEVLLSRIRERAKNPDRFFERWILKKYPEYPVRLARNVEQWVANNAGETPILTIDTSKLDCSNHLGRIQVAGMTDGYIRQFLSERASLPS